MNGTKGMKMLERINTELDRLEKEENMKILLAIESGSRAWGFPSTDSDFDVRVIAIQPRSHYLAIDPPKESFDYFLGKELDINAWDLRKALRLLRKSNLTPIEWAQSPIVYRTCEGFSEKLLALAAKYFRQGKAIRHYKGIAMNSMAAATVNGREVRLKKFFYVLRPVLAARWIMRYGTMPPMDIFNLMKQIEKEDLLSTINSLIAVKATAQESDTESVVPLLFDYVKAELDLVCAYTGEDTFTETGSEDLNAFFLDQLD
ncbi:nucleotidyltransferase domain-containing protein [Chitinophagales bacterium]|nr:nucleotidyltransferase domain-containing protein [Chitinophagales bacterium]